jgi:hypothetical protein
MPWKAPFNEPLPAEQALDVFRDSVARLSLRGDTVGYLAFRCAATCGGVNGMRP